MCPAGGGERAARKWNAPPVEVEDVASVALSRWKI